MILIIMLSFSIGYSQPNPPSSHGNENNTTGGSAPIGEGVGFLMLFASTYVLSRVYRDRNSQKD
jgi:hypothetical protein